MTAAAKAPLSNAGVKRLAEAVLRAEKSPMVALSITFVGPAQIRKLNRVHLGHDRETDVIAFDLLGVGDVYVCPTVAARNAKGLETTPRAEVRRLVIHGILHTLGYDHADGKDRTNGTMWTKQEALLKKFGSLAP